MKKLFLVFLLLQIGLFAQLNNTNKWIMRGDNVTLSFNYKTELTNDTLIFVAKASKDITAVRLIEKTTYDNEISLSGTSRTSIFILLSSGDTDDLTLSRYFYDITRIKNGDTTTIIIGELYLQPDIGTPFDGTDVTGRVTTVSLNNGTSLNSVVVWDTTNQYWKPMSFSTFESLLNVSPSSLPDSILYPEDSTANRTFSDLKYATKAEANAIIDLPDTTGVTSGYVPKYVGGSLVWSSDISEAGTGVFNPDDAWVDTTALGEATLSDAVKDTLAYVKGTIRNIPDKESGIRLEGYNGGVVGTTSITVPVDSTGENSVIYVDPNWADDFFTDFNGTDVIGYWVFRTTNGNEITDWDSYLTGAEISPSQVLGVYQDLVNDIIIVSDTFTVDNTWNTDTTGIYLQIKNTTGINSQFTLTYLAQYFMPLEDVPSTVAEGEENYKTKIQIWTEIQDYDFADIVHFNTDPDTTIITVARYGTAGVDADYVGNNAIQEAINSITDNGQYNTYVIEIGEGVYEALDSTDLTVTDVWNIRNFVEGKDYVSLKGANREKTIISMNLPDDYDSSFTYDRAQTIRWDCAYTTLENITVIAKNARYAIHREGSTTGNTDETTIIKNCAFIHKGNSGEATADWNATYPFGLGISQGEKLYVSDSYFEGANLHAAIYFHANPGANKAIYYEFDNCVFAGGTIAAYSWATNSNDRLVIKNSTFLDRRVIDYGSIPEQRENDADNAEIQLDIDDSPLVISTNSLGGRGLKITSNLTNSNSTVRFVETSTAFTSIIGDTSEILTETIYNDSTVYGYRFKNGGGGLNGYAISGIDIDSTQVTKPLGLRLGDCSSVNKVLGIVINDTTYNVTFNADYTAVGTWVILGMINTAISGHGVATLYKAGQDYYPKFRGNQILVNSDTTAIYQGMGIVFDDNKTMRKAKNTDYYIDGICIDDVAPNGFGRVITEGDIFSQYSDKRYDVLEVSTATRLAGTGLGISTTQDGYFDVLATPSVLRAFNTDMLRFATTGATFTGDVSVPDADYGDVTISGGVWSVEDNSHSHTMANVTDLTDTLGAKMNRAEMSGYSQTTHTHIEFSDTVRVGGWSIGMGNTDLDTLIAGSFGGIKIPNDYTVTEVAAYTNSGTVTFNIEERAETTPNTSGTDVMTSDLVADTDQQETGTFSNATLDRNDWLILTIVSISGEPTIFSVTVRGVKTD